MEPNRFVRSKHPFRVCVGGCGEMGGLRRRTNPRTVAPPTMATKTMANALAKSVRELRIHFCQTSEASAGTRCVAGRRKTSVKSTGWIGRVGLKPRQEEQERLTISNGRCNACQGFRALVLQNPQGSRSRTTHPRARSQRCGSKDVRQVRFRSGEKRVTGRPGQKRSGQCAAKSAAARKRSPEKSKGYSLAISRGIHSRPLNKVQSTDC